MSYNNALKFASMHKSTTIYNIRQVQQEQRRKKLLEQQKSQRARTQDDNRKIKEFVQKIRKKGRKRLEQLAHQVQLSEWLRTKPDDLEKWYLVPCPKGQRCLIIASDGFTEMYNKRGQFMWSFHSKLPGDGSCKSHVTVLDCIYVSTTSTYFILDVIAYGNQDMGNCEAEFRFFWIHSKLHDEPLIETCNNSKYNFKSLPFYSFQDETAISACLLKYPQFENGSPELDGFLFYHKESSYIYGPTPLVGWLFAFMIPEILQLEVHEEYMQIKPENYINATYYMNSFDKQLLQQKSQRKEQQNQQSSYQSNLMYNLAMAEAMDTVCTECIRCDGEDCRCGNCADCVIHCDDSCTNCF